MPLIKVKDNPNLFRDNYSKAVINNDMNAYNEYLANRERLKLQQEMILSNKTDIDTLKADVATIKELIQSIASKIQGKE